MVLYTSSVGMKPDGLIYHLLIHLLDVRAI